MVSPFMFLMSKPHFVILLLSCLGLKPDLEIGVDIGGTRVTVPGRESEFSAEIVNDLFEWSALDDIEAFNIGFLNFPFLSRVPARLELIAHVYGTCRKAVK